MSFFKAGDTINGQEAKATITIKNPNSPSTVEDLFYGKDLDATCSINKTEVRTLGKRGTQHKPNGWTGTGKMTIYYATSLFREMAIRYMKTGIPTYFDLTITNEDPASTLGSQTTVLKDCTLDEISLAKFDVESEVLDESVNFTFEDADLLDVFGKPLM